MKNANFSSCQGKVAVVTGGASGIGLAIVSLFAMNGMKVVVADIQDEDGLKVVETIKNEGGEAIFCHTNVMNEDDIINVTKKAIEEFGQLHVMVNNAGVGSDLRPIHEFESDTFKRISDINFIGAFLGMKYGVKAMLESKARGCSVINISSANGIVANANYAAYDATKSAVNHMTRVAGLDYAKYDITVNAICPGTIETPIYSKITPIQKEISLASVPMGRFGRPEEIAYMALFLASDMARYITGSIISVDAGLTAGNYREVEWNEPYSRNDDA